MQEKEWRIAIFGTFDVENYGDLLFPLIAEAELARRLGPVTLFRFSYNAKTPPEWPYTVTSLTELPALADSLDGVLIGGGFIIRFDKDVARGYGPPTAAIHHPTGYWLTPGLIALQLGIPLIWNAPGMHCNDIPAWAEPLLALTLEQSRYVSVRDAPSRTTLGRFAGQTPITLLPDTAFGLSRLIDEQEPSAEFSDLRERMGLTGRYIVVQAANCLDAFLHLVREHPQRFRDYHFLVLPIGPILGDHESIIGDALPGAIRLPFWPQPMLLAELIGHAEAVIGHSYHLAITALGFGVPVFSSADLQAGKYTSLSDFETIHALPRATSGIDPEWFLARLGNKRPAAAAGAALDQLAEHWDRIAAILREGRTDTQPILNRYWQTLPNQLESAAERTLELETALQEKRRQIDELREQLDLARTETLALYNSWSWKIAAPPRMLLRILKRVMRLSE